MTRLYRINCFFQLLYGMAMGAVALLCRGGAAGVALRRCRGRGCVWEGVRPYELAPCLADLNLQTAAEGGCCFNIFIIFKVFVYNV